MTSILRCTIADTAGRLTTPDAVRAFLNTNVSNDDASAWITSASAQIIGLLNWRSAMDEGLSVARQSYRELFLLSSRACETRLILSRQNCEITSLTVEGVQLELPLSGIEIDPGLGIIYNARQGGFSGRVEIEYDAGWIMPGQVDRNLPQVFEDACLHMIHRTRVHMGDSCVSPAVQSRSEPDLGSWQFAIERPDSRGGVPAQIISMLQPYIRMGVAAV